MHRTVTAAALLAAAFALPALADKQRALSLGVAPGAFSATELSLLSQARENNDHQLERRILGRGAAVERRDPALATGVGAGRVDASGRDQLAASLGVEGAGHSRAELARLHFDASED